MIRVNIICEGDTEERFVEDILFHHLIGLNIQATPRNIGRGNSYFKIRQNVVQWLKEEPNAWVTTLIDLYGMNGDFPGYAANKHLSPYKKITAVEDSFRQDIDKEKLINWRFIPHYQLHEFEAMLFADPDTTEDWLSLDYLVPAGCLSGVAKQFDTPECINDSPLTAPSKRILSAIPTYNKVADGNLILNEIGLKKIREQCPHFNDWLTKLENLK